MKCLNISTLLLITILVSSLELQAQNRSNEEIIKDIYKELQETALLSKTITQLTPHISWEKPGKTGKETQRHQLRFQDAVRDLWGGVSFDRLSYKAAENEIVVTGFISGRQPGECEYVTTAFTHHWTIENGQLIKFLE